VYSPPRVACSRALTSVIVARISDSALGPARRELDGPRIGARGYAGIRAH
jgi:hypothetical protein